MTAVEERNATRWSHAARCRGSRTESERVANVHSVICTASSTSAGCERHRHTVAIIAACRSTNAAKASSSASSFQAANNSPSSSDRRSETDGGSPGWVVRSAAG